MRYSNDVEVIDRGTFEEGHVLWILVRDADAGAARKVAETYGRITESDQAEDGRWSFAVVADAPRELLSCGHYIWEHGSRGGCPR